ncbi:MAG: hypothetical protein H7Y59_07965 [Anaerolineales bacterium]|nr:hypothetical protein [Anaerolineales bacterium]
MRYLTILSMLGLGILLSACGSASNSTGAVDAVEGYVNALASNDEASLSALSCAEWETNALTELDSLQAVTASLESFSCQQSGTDGDTALVDCEGKMILSYNGEDQELDLSNRTYQVVEQSGSWLVCGTQ